MAPIRDPNQDPLLTPKNCALFFDMHRSAGVAAAED